MTNFGCATALPLHTQDSYMCTRQKNTLCRQSILSPFTTAQHGDNALHVMSKEKCCNFDKDNKALHPCLPSSGVIQSIHVQCKA